MGFKPCAVVGCGTLVPAGQRYCDKHRLAKEKQAVDRRREARSRFRDERRKARQAERGRQTAHERGYTHKWQKARSQYLCSNPLCVHCQAEGVLTEATVVDHIIPHKGDKGLFWDQSNWQSLCKRHHDQKTASEDGGFGRE